MESRAPRANRGAELLAVVVFVPAVDQLQIALATHVAITKIRNITHLFNLEFGMLGKTIDTDIHPVALAIWMLILALEDRLEATIAGNAIRQG